MSAVRKYALGARSILAVLIFPLLFGCTVVDSVENRADTMNESVTRFRNSAILRNIVRAMNDEPLNFAALSSITGHNTLDVGLSGIPGLVWGPHVAAVTHTLSPQSNQYNVASDFNFNESDDPATYAALLSPLDAATIANFYQYSVDATDYYLMLFVDTIRVANQDGFIIGDFRGEDLLSDRNSERRRYALWAFEKLAYTGLLFNAERGALVGQAKKPRTQICFHSEYYQTNNKYFPHSWHEILTSGGQENLAPKGKIVLPTGANAKTPITASFCHEEGTWLPAPSSDSATTSNNNIVCVQNVKTTSNCGPSKDKPAHQPAAYVVYDSGNKLYFELTTRSTWGIYQFLGAAADKGLNKNIWIEMVRPPHTEKSTRLFNIGRDVSGECFTEIDDKHHYCIPDNEDSKYTKRVFSILHHLTGLQTAALNLTGNPSTVRITP